MTDVDPPPETPPVSCFVIGPIGDRDASHGSPERTTYEDAVQVWEEIIQPACGAFGILPVRADHISKTGEIPEQIFRRLRDDYLVIADLTKANPNVMYELGLRHTTGKLTVQIGEREHLPFDLAAIRTIRFRRSEAGLIEARKQLTHAISVGLRDGGDFVTATRVWFEELGSNYALTIDAGAAAAEGPEEELGFLEKLDEMSKGINGLTKTGENIAAVTNEFGALVRDANEKATRINTLGGAAGAKAEIADRLARTLEDPAIRLDVLAGEYKLSFERIHPGLVWALDQVKKNPQLRLEAVSFLTVLKSLVTTIKSITPDIMAFKASLLVAGEATRALRRTNRRIAATLQVIIETNSRMDHWDKMLDDLNQG
jgi:hypothetical protein